MENQVLTVGQQLKKFLRGEGISQEHAAKMMGITRPTLSEYINRAVFPSDALQNVKKLWPGFIATIGYGDGSDQPPVQVSEPDTKTPDAKALGEPARSSLEEDLTRALIRAQDEMIEANKAHRKLTDALLEKDRKLSEQSAPRSSLDELKSKMDLNFRHDEQVDLFLAMQIADLAGKPVLDLLDEMHNALSNGPIDLDTYMKAEKGKLSKA